MGKYYISDTNNNIRGSKSQNIHVASDPGHEATNSQAMGKVRKSTRIGQRPKRLGDYIC